MFAAALHIVFVLIIASVMASRHGGDPLNATPPLRMQSNPPREALRYAVEVPMEPFTALLCIIGFTAAFLETRKTPARAYWPMQYAQRVLQGILLALSSGASESILLVAYVGFLSGCAVLMDATTADERDAVAAERGPDEAHALQPVDAFAVIMRGAVIGMAVFVAIAQDSATASAIFWVALVCYSAHTLVNTVALRTEAPLYTTAESILNAALNACFVVRTVARV